MCSEPYLPYSLEIDNNETTPPNSLFTDPIDPDNSLDILTIYCPEDPEIRDI